MGVWMVVSVVFKQCVLERLLHPLSSPYLMIEISEIIFIKLLE
jgi:hypothetical protein